MGETCLDATDMRRTLGRMAHEVLEHNKGSDNLVVVGILSFLVALSGYHFRRLRPILEGEPVVVIQNGEVIAGNLKRQRITLEELAAQARLQQIASLEDVGWAIIEKSGQISFIPKPQEIAGDAA